MPTTDEHDDDLEPAVADDATIETERYDQGDDEEVVSGADVMNQSEVQPLGGGEGHREEEGEDEASDSI